MPKFEISDNGKRYELNAPDQQSAIAAFQKFKGGGSTPPAGAQPGSQEYAQWAAARAKAGYALPQVSAPPPPPASQPGTSPLDQIAAGFTAGVDAIPIAGPYAMGGLNNLKAAKYGVSADQIAADNRANEEANPIAATAGKVAGTVLPFMAGGEIPVVAKALGMSGGLGSQIGFGAASGGLLNGGDTLARGGSLQDAFVSGAIGTAAGAALPGVLAGFKKLGGAAVPKGAVPTIPDLGAAKDAAYAAVDNAGIAFTPKQINGLVTDMLQSAAKDHINPDLHTAAFAKLADIQQRGGGMTLTQLDQLRQEIYRDVVSKGGGDAHFGREFVDNIDNLIETSMFGNATMLAARAAHSTLKKSEALQEAIEGVQRQVATTGSGGNINNALRQALNRLLSNKKLRWTKDERNTIGNVVLGGKMDNLLRLVGKLSPSGNGLSAFLGILGTAHNPALAPIPLAGLAAKTIADGATKRGVAKVETLVRSGKVPVSAPSVGLPALLPPGGAYPLLAPSPQPVQIRIGTKGLPTY